MSLQKTKRETAINNDFESLTKGAAKAVSDVSTQVSMLKILVPFMHDNVLGGKGDVSEGDRVDLRDSLVPLYEQLQELMGEMEKVFVIHDDDVSVWQAALDAYIVEYPNCVNEAEARYPKVL